MFEVIAFHGDGSDLRKPQEKSPFPAGKFRKLMDN
jgi:hypothetical protein